MTELTLTVTRSVSEQSVAHNFLATQASKPMRLLLSMAAICVISIMAGLGAGVLFGLPLWAAAAVSGYALLGAFVAFNLVRWVNGRRNAVLLARSPLLGSPWSLVLSPGGVILRERHHPWQHFSGISRYKGLTILRSTAIDGLVIPDRDLPAGLTPEDFAMQVERWRTS